MKKVVFDPKLIESKWKSVWESQILKRAKNGDVVNSNKSKVINNNNKENERRKYILAMFPYPSGSLHMGHVRVYSISDAISRVYKMKGYDVLHPMGWDAFGLPAENAARDHNKSPEEWTNGNIEYMRSQLRALGFNFTNNILLNDIKSKHPEWELDTSDPTYFKWTQWLFLQMHKAGLAYRADAIVNWDPIDKTVLANEQVDANGCSWRSGAKVEKRPLEQWFLKITAYANHLLQGLDKNPISNKWPNQVAEMQRQWIGESKGVRIQFPIANLESTAVSAPVIPIFTTRPDTFLDVTFLALSKTKAKQIFLKSDIKDNSFTGYYAVHPLLKVKIPIYVADYVLDDYGEGAVMGVPKFDERDGLFAKKMDIPINLHVNLSDTNEIADIKEHIVSTGLGTNHTVYRLRDWLVSRQRRWGAPIPMLHCISDKKCGSVPVPEESLPVSLPPRAVSENDVAKFKEDTKNGKVDKSNPMNKWLSARCPKCGGPAHRDPDSLDTFVDSSWYFYRFCAISENMIPSSESKNGNIDISKYAFGASDASPVKTWMGKSGVDVYVGGIEHAILHLLYARFFHHFLRTNGILSLDAPEPFSQLVAQGMVLGKTFKEKGTGKYLKAFEEGKTDIVWEKMSKSKYNGVNPMDIVNEYGADATRLAILFASPPEKSLEWDIRLVEGQSRFIKRVWGLVGDFVDAESIEVSKKQSDTSVPASNQDSTLDDQEPLLITVKRVISNVSDMVTEQRSAFNTAISELMKLSNSLSSQSNKTSVEYIAGVYALVRMLAPFAPHVTEEMWEHLQPAMRKKYEKEFPIAQDKGIHEQPWPTEEEIKKIELISDQTTKRKIFGTLIYQINGKRRGEQKIPIEELQEIMKSNSRDVKITDPAAQSILNYAKNGGINNYDSVFGNKKVTKMIIVPYGQASKAPKDNVQQQQQQQQQTTISEGVMYLISIVVK